VAPALGAVVVVVGQMVFVVVSVAVAEDGAVGADAAVGGGGAVRREAAQEHANTTSMLTAPMCRVFRRCCDAATPKNDRAVELYAMSRCSGSDAAV